MSSTRWTRANWLLGSLLAVGVAMGQTTPTATTGWNVDGDGAWSTAGNWTNGVPTQDTVAVFGSVGSDTTTARTITLGGNSAMWEMVADGSADYSISGPDYSLTVGRNVGNGVATTAGNITVSDGDHVIDVSAFTWNSAVNSSTYWTVADGASLHVTSPVTIPGNVVCFFDGGGTIRIDGTISAFDGYGGGSILNGTTTLRLDPGVGALQGTPYDLVDLSGADAVSSFDIGDFSVVNNLAYGATLQWDATGKVLQCVVAVPKGTTITIR